MPTEPSPITLAEVVRRACELVDPDDTDAAIGEYERAFEDADEPIRAIDDLEERVGLVLSDLDPATNNASLSMVAAVTVYLGFRRDEFGAEPAKLLRLAAEAEWEGRPPEPVVEWLADRDIKVHR
ncbi:MAG: hypothetical protein ACR2NR_12195 [Solirubrobacteraceae bacterium]